jgi:hypothetical protein
MFPLALCAAFVGMPVLSGCEKEVSKESTTVRKSDGTVKQEETKVTKNPDGTVTEKKTEHTSNP